MKKYFIILIVIIFVKNIFAFDYQEWKNAKAKRLAQSILRYHQLSKIYSPGENQLSYDVKYYELNFSFDLDNEILFGKILIDVDVIGDSLNKIELDLENHLTVDSVVGDNIDDFQFSNNKLNVILSRYYKKNEKVKFYVYYHGHPVEDGFMAFSFSKNDDGGLLIATLSEPFFARYWWPCKDLPNDKADSVDIYVTVPDTLIASSNGILKDTVRNGEYLTYHWHEGYPITTYLVSLAISNYKYMEDVWEYNNEKMKVCCFYYPDDSDDYARSSIDIHKNALTIYSNLFGIYPFIKEKYGVSKFEWGGGMEHQTNTSATGFSEYLLVHELGHQWWGDYITCENWHDIWLNEGFASYCEALYFEFRNGNNDKEALHHYVNNHFNSGLENKIYVEDTSYVWNIFSRTVYDKGAWVLHMLRHIVSDSVFFEILHTYYNRYPYSVAKTSDFVNVCNEIYGNDLTYFFNQWIYSEGMPEYDVIWSVSDDTVLNLVVSQTQNVRTIFKMPIDLKVYFEDNSDTLLVIMNNQKMQYYTLHLNNKIKKIEIDPDNWILKKGDVSYRTSINEKNQNTKQTPEVSVFPNPFKNFLYFEIKNINSTSLDIEIYNIVGQCIYKQKYTVQNNNRKIKISLDKISSGMYFYRVVAKDKKVYAGKIECIK